jgi:hypothetical protein
MASALDSILDIVKRKISERAGGPRDGASGSGGILGQLGELLNKRTGAGRGPGRNVRPASEDPYGDPADAKGAGRVKPASEDPYGDPGDRK